MEIDGFYVSLTAGYMKGNGTIVKITLHTGAVFDATDKTNNVETILS